MNETSAIETPSTEQPAPILCCDEIERAECCEPREQANCCPTPEATASGTCGCR
jgi:hypothetical protein